MGHIRISPAASKNQLEKDEGREFGEKWQVRISCLENGLIFYMIPSINKS